MSTYFLIFSKSFSMLN